MPRPCLPILAASTCFSLERFLCVRLTRVQESFQCYGALPDQPTVWSERNLRTTSETRGWWFSREQQYRIVGPPRFSRLACDEPTSKTPHYLEMFIRPKMPIILQNISITHVRIAIAMSRNDGIYRFVIQETTITAIIMSYKTLPTKHVQAWS